ncbi:MAG: lysoplasmalogenase [Pseudomonadota bacterium]
MTVLSWILVCALAMAAMVLAERLGSARGRWAAKPVASLAFVGLALAQGLPPTAYGRVVLVALVLCLLGDLLLLPERTGPAFLAGLGSFLLGHLAFAAAFFVLGPDLPWTAAATVALLLPAALVLRWLWPHLRGPLRMAVPAYITAITAMVALAVGAGRAGGPWWVPLGAVLFFLSDISVARDRFVAPGWKNRLWGLPLYYGAQVLLALSALGYSPKG